jgi:hypothetical protein
MLLSTLIAMALSLGCETKEVKQVRKGMDDVKRHADEIEKEAKIHSTSKNRTAPANMVRLLS